MATHEYRHIDGVNSCGAAAGTELDLVLAGDPDWTLIGSADEPVQAVQDPEQAEDPAETVEIPEDLHSLRREELDELAASLGVEDAAGLPNKDAVITAIQAVQDPEQAD